MMNYHQYSHERATKSPGQDNLDAELFYGRLSLLFMIRREKTLMTGSREKIQNTKERIIDCL